MKQSLIESNGQTSGLFIDGQWREAAHKEVFQVENPSNGEVIAEVCDATSNDARAAFEAACKAQDAWAATAPRYRSEILRNAFEILKRDSEQFASLITLEMGKPIAESRGEVAYANEFLRWFSEEAVRIGGRTGSVPEGHLGLITRRKPVGPSLLITPWNFPLAMITRKVGPAIAAGCTMVIKPAALTPLTALKLGEVFVEAGLPAGVLNIVPSSRASEISGPILADSRLRKISFTGSTNVGKILMKAAADNVVRSSMELGGNAPFLVFEDANLDQAIEGAVAAKLRNNGEACTAANRFIVHSSVYEEFSRRLAERFDQLTVGDGLLESTDCGPLIDSRSLANIESLIQDALQRGAKRITRDEQFDGPGHFMRPTLLTNVDPESRIINEEIFGPVAPIVSFENDAEAWQIANQTEYGLASYVYTESLDRLLTASDQIEAGIMGWNSGVVSNAAAPFGGVKQSGTGREGGIEGIEDYTTLQYIGTRLPTS